MTKNIIQYEIIKKTGIEYNILFYKRNNHDILTCNFIVYKYKYNSILQNFNWKFNQSDFKIYIFIWIRVQLIIFDFFYQY